MKNFTKIITATTIILSLSSCAMIQDLLKPKKVVELDYLDGANKMDMKQFFDGNIEAFAIKQDANGKIIATFTAKINGKWEDNKGVIQQNFLYSDGAKDSRTWLVTLDTDGTFEAVGHNVSVPAKGKQIGNAAQSNYSLNLSSKTGKEEVNFEDKMYLVDENSMIMISDFGNKKSEKVASGKIIYSLKKAAK
jgi:hypothetical protein